MSDNDVDFKLFRYDPSMAAAILFAILFLAISVIHAYQLIRTQTWIFVPFAIGGFCKFTSSNLCMFANQLFLICLVQCVGYAGVSAVAHDLQEAI